MADEDSMVVDLWGNETYLVKRTKGRPPFEWTSENSNKVSMLLAMGWSNDRIRGCIRDPRTGKIISNPTLKRHFRAELQIRDQQRDQLVAKQLMVTADSAFSGNVGAMRLLQQLIEKNDLVLAEVSFGKVADTIQPKLGKKQIDELASKQADDDLMADLEKEAGNIVRH
ncbi:MAG: hypothetical protein JKY94_08090 [Rhodobacteraceae bacterium]|nr:hypothetical protein [Paracoccaceae bacterium]